MIVLERVFTPLSKKTDALKGQALTLITMHPNSKDYNPWISLCKNGNKIHTEVRRAHALLDYHKPIPEEFNLIYNELKKMLRPPLTRLAPIRPAPGLLWRALCVSVTPVTATASAIGSVFSGTPKP